jgi:hypothetical protein
VCLRDPQTKRKQHIGSYASEEDAARAYDCAAVQARGPGAKRNFTGDAISELPVTVGEERKKRSSSRFAGVSWNKSQSSFQAQLTDPQTKRRHIGYYASEEDAARAYDCAAVQAHGPGAKLNFPPASDTDHVSDGDEPPPPANASAREEGLEAEAAADPVAAAAVAAAAAAAAAAPWASQWGSHARFALS